jgi:hypothetical protein
MIIVILQCSEALPHLSLEVLSCLDKIVQIIGVVAVDPLRGLMTPLLIAFCGG